MFVPLLILCLSLHTFLPASEVGGPGDVKRGVAAVGEEKKKREFIADPNDPINKKLSALVIQIGDLGNTYNEKTEKTADTILAEIKDLLAQGANPNMMVTDYSTPLEYVFFKRIFTEPGARAYLPQPKVRPIKQILYRLIMMLLEHGGRVRSENPIHEHALLVSMADLPEQYMVSLFNPSKHNTSKVKRRMIQNGKYEVIRIMLESGYYKNLSPDTLNAEFAQDIDTLSESAYGMSEKIVGLITQELIKHFKAAGGNLDNVRFKTVYEPIIFHLLLDNGMQVTAENIHNLMRSIIHGIGDHISFTKLSSDDLDKIKSAASIILQKFIQASAINGLYPMIDEYGQPTRRNLLDDLLMQYQASNESRSVFEIYQALIMILLQFGAKPTIELTEDMKKIVAAVTTETKKAIAESPYGASRGVASVLEQFMFGGEEPRETVGEVKPEAGDAKSAAAGKS